MNRFLCIANGLACLGNSAVYLSGISGVPLMSLAVVVATGAACWWAGSLTLRGL